MILFEEKQQRIEPAHVEKGLEFYLLPEEGTYTLIEPMRRVRTSWTPMCIAHHMVPQWFHPIINDASFQCGAPILATIDGRGNNCATLALSDTVKTTRMSFCVDDLSQKDELIYKIELKKDGVWQRDDKEVILRVDRRELPYYEALKDAGEFTRKNLRSIARVPGNAKEALYSSWYNFHQQPEQRLLTEELEAAAEMGFRTVILDDGWQFECAATGDYFKCGDWHVAEDKFPDFKGFADRVHALGMKLMLWFPVPFAGYDTRDYARLKDRMAVNIDSMRAGVLDIRYKDIRDYIIGIYERFASEYGIDGLKLDFIDAFNIDPASLPPVNDAMDHSTLNEAARTLMDEIYDRMTAVDPDFLFEFRQWYVGAEIVNHGNMLRVADCAYDSATNRIGVAALRLVNGCTAIHSDMLLWGMNDSPETVALQLLDVLFSVPQISVLLTKIPSGQLRVLRQFLKYWTENKDVLLGGAFEAGLPGFNYDYMAACKDGVRITVLYGRSDFEPSGAKVREDVFNAGRSGFILASGWDKFLSAGQGAGAATEYRIYDCFGEELERGAVNSDKLRFNVPVGGRLSIIP